VVFPSTGITQIKSAGGELLEGRAHGRGTVLVVDDEEVVREVAKRALENGGYAVLCADGGRSALEILKRLRDRISLVLLDLSMPEMSGQDVLRRLREIDSGMKVIVSSGYSERETMKLFAGQTLSGFLQKPYSNAQLARKVKAALDAV
jgi:CheY-like chemotaxis protein